jgi:hypothetical protein
VSAQLASRSQPLAEGASADRMKYLETESLNRRVRR